MGRIQDFIMSDSAGLKRYIQLSHLSSGRTKAGEGKCLTQVCSLGQG